MSERFYVNCPLAEGVAVELAGAEAHHLATVRRFRPGDQAYLFNGDGNEYTARVLAVERRRVTLEVLKRSAPPRELPFALEVAAPLPKGDRAQLLIEKLTELGVTSFVPLSTRRSVVQPREARLDRLQRQVIEASKQCGRNTLLRVGPRTDWLDYGAAPGGLGLRVVAHPGAVASNPLEALALAPGQALTAAVGPEGGFTEEEIEAARAAGWRLLDLGPRTLRVETAALVLAAWAVAANAR
jgi:16S rRNA (uracil1498-N3)-methyltransferase